MLFNKLYPEIWIKNEFQNKVVAYISEEDNRQLKDFPYSGDILELELYLVSNIPRDKLKENLEKINSDSSDPCEIIDELPIGDNIFNTEPKITKDSTVIKLGGYIWTYNDLFEEFAQEDELEELIKKIEQ